MTLICGYIYQNTVAIIADSAETIVSSSPLHFPDDVPPNSTFQERFFQEGDTTVVESAQKIYVLREKVIITFAGEVGSGLRVVEELNYLLLNEASLKDLVRNYFESIQLDNHFLIGFMDDAAAHLYYYNGPQTQGIEVGHRLIMLGANLQSISWRLPFVYDDAASKGINAQEALIYFLANVQAMTIHNQTINEGIGGYFNGVMVHSGGIEWAKDTTYLLYAAKHDDSADKFIAAKYNRDNITFITSTFYDRLFVTELDNTRAKEIFDKWIESVMYKSSRMQSDYYVLIAYDQKNIVILDRDKEGGVTYMQDGERYGFKLSDLALEAMYYDHPRKESYYLTFSNFF